MTAENSASSDATGSARLAHVVVISGPSGSGKSRLARQLSRDLGWPFVNLDDFYRDADEPGLPTLPNGETDWDDPGTWNEGSAAECLEELCNSGTALAPIYSISSSSRQGTKSVNLDGAKFVVAEGIFAPYVISELTERGLLAEAWCLRRNRSVTAARRFIRDVSERRKPVGVLVRRGFRLWRDEPTLVKSHEALGAQPVSFKTALRRARKLASASPN